MGTSTRNASNRRAGLRRQPRGNIQVTCVKGALGLGSNLALTLLDASETGVRLIVTTALEPGQEIEVSITGPGRGRPHKQLAEVAWCVPTAEGAFCVGARFLKRLSYAELQDICR
jgi:hypothetical protein